MIGAGRHAIRLVIKVVPGSSQEGIAGWLGDALKVRVRAPAEGGKANAAVERVLAHALGVAAAQARVIRGKTSARKVVEVSELSDVEVSARLAVVLGDSR